MSSTIVLKSIGRIISALPNGLVLDCEQPDKPHQSRVVIKRAGEGNLQHFYLCCKSTGDKSIGFLATYDLKNVLMATLTGASEVRYIQSPSVIANGAPFPTWVTPEMMFDIQQKDSGLCQLVSMVDRTPKLVMDVFQMVDKEGNTIIVYPMKDGVHKNQLFKLQNMPN